jgi:hypothetical protein
MTDKNYNWRYLQGMKTVTDDVYCKTLGLPTTLAYTPEINECFIAEQSDPDKARQEIRILMANRGILPEGY